MKIKLRQLYASPLGVFMADQVADLPEAIALSLVKTKQAFPVAAPLETAKAAPVGEIRQAVKMVDAPEDATDGDDERPKRRGRK